MQYPVYPDVLSTPGLSSAKLRRALLQLAALGCVSPLAFAQTSSPATYPNRPVRLVVSYAAGNVTDLLARLVADKLSHIWGQPVVVENRPGSGGSLGAQSVMREQADGYTLLFSAMAAMAINPHVYANLGYDVRKNFTPIVNVAYPSSILAISPNLNIQTLPALVAYSKAHPTELSFGTAGSGTVPHLAIELLKSETGLVAQHVPYKSASAALTDLIGGRIQMQLDSVSVLLPQVNAHKIVAIAAGSTMRLKQLPELPTMTELYPKYQAVIPWLGIFAPAGTAKAVVDKVNKDVNEVLRLADVQDKLQANGLSSVGGSSEDFSRTIASDFERMGRLVKQLNLKVD